MRCLALVFVLSVFLLLVSRGPTPAAAAAASETAFSPDNEFGDSAKIKARITALTNGFANPFKSFFPRVDYQECLKRSICEAHHDRMKFGVVGLAMQMIFPPFDRNIFGSRIRRPFALAAQYGASRRSDCSRQYDGCVISWLRVMQKTMDYILIKRDNRDSHTLQSAAVKLHE